MTFASKTTVACDCGYLARAAKDPDLPIEFDARLNEFHILHSKGRLIIYHCPFCGGRMPDSLRSTFFTEISDQEQQRLLALVVGLDSLERVLESLGEPDESVEGMREGQQPPEDTPLRVLRYSRFSDVANIVVRVSVDGKIAIWIEGRRKE